MARNQVVTVDESTSIRQVSKEMSDSGCSFIPVLRSGKPVGVITGRDIVTRMFGRGISSQDTPVAAIMSTPAVTVNDGAEASEALMLMRQQDLHRLVVTDETGAVQSVISLCDLAGSMPNDFVVENLRRHAETSHRRALNDYTCQIPGLYIG